VNTVKETFLTFPLRILSHPFKGFDEMKFEKKGKILYAVVMLVLFGLLAMMNSAYKGFVLTGYWQESPNVNIPYVMLMTYAPIVLFVIANWSITSITDGKGKMKEIFLTYTYAMYPRFFCVLFGLILSNYVTKDEAAFATFFYVFAEVCFYFYLFIGLIIIHE